MYHVARVMQGYRGMFHAQINHFENDEQQAKLTLIGLVAMAIIISLMIVAAVMRA
jgi:hypothetical protein